MKVGWYLLAPLTLPVMLGAQVATVRGPAPAPGGPYVLHAVVPTPTSVTGSISVGSFQTESAVIGSTLTHNYHEVFALVAGGGVGPFPVNDTARRPTRSFLDPAAVAAFTDPNAIVLEITDDAGSVRFPLTGPPRPGSRLVIDNNLARVRLEHVSLGRFGNAQCWLMLRTGLKQIDVILNWHTGAIGNGDVLFRHAKVICPSGVRWIPNLADSVSQNGYLVKPTGNGLPHIMPMRHDRAFRFSVLPTSLPYRAPWSWNGMADWSRGGAPVAGFPTPVSINGANLDAEATWWRNGLQNMTPWGGGGGTPVSPLWPAAGGNYGGLTSGEDMVPFDGVRWLVTAQTSGFERFATEQLRMQSRIRGCIVEADGGPVRPWEHLVNGQATWRMYNSVFERQNWPNQHLPQAGPFIYPLTRLLSQAAYNPEAFDPTDCQHLIRDTNHKATLIMATADPLAMYQLKMEAAKSLMTFWHGFGTANRFGPMPTAGRGIEWDRGWAWAAMCIAHNYVWSGPAECVAQYDPWIRKFVDYLQAGQMPSGIFSAYGTGPVVPKECKNPPYGTNPVGEGTPQHYIGSGLGDCYFAAALAHLERISSHESARVPGLLQQQAAGLKDLAWCTNDDGSFAGGVWYTYGVGPFGSTARYMTRADWTGPSSVPGTTLAEGMAIYDPPRVPYYVYNDGFHVGYMLAAIKRAGAPQADVLLNRFTGRSTVAQSLTTMIGWGAGSQTWQSGSTPCEQFSAAIGQWSNP